MLSFSSVEYTTIIGIRICKDLNKILELAHSRLKGITLPFSSR